MSILLSLAACVISAFWARSKGFSPWAWVCAGGLLGWLFLAFLMPATGARCPPELEQRRATRGNIVGIAISVLAIAVLLYRAGD